MDRRTFCSLPLAAGAVTRVDPGAPRKAIERWKDLRFGMFIHWGPVSIVGTEIGWSRGAERRGHKGVGPVPVEIYDNLYRMFNPVRFDAAEWMRVARQSGMKYVVFTTKHHDGFCNFDSKLTDYKITSPHCPYGKDIVKQLADACHQAGLMWGHYYSQPDWHHPDYRNGERHARYIEYLHGQVRELLTNYGKVGTWFFDGLGGTAADWDAPRLLAMMRQLQPELVINNRAGLPADLDTPEQKVGFFQNTRPWETCATLSGQWAFKPWDELRTFPECIRLLVCCATGDGNLLLNVGPMPDGRIEPRQVERLSEVGMFLEKYGESIYGTRGGPVVAPDEKVRDQSVKFTGFTLSQGRWWGGTTHRGNTLYVHILRWPSETIALPPLGRKLIRHAVLTGGTAELKEDAAGISLAVRPEQRHAVDTIVRLEFDGPLRAA
ncbi:MAG TPA: alpha-L-fucosidase [Bryobacteraceae bacterium]|nr:alpha-L-fucosidase [Bryobacteraceae bacterium]